jgi:hypothetical protein
MLTRIQRNFSTIYEFLYFIYIFCFALIVSILLKTTKIQTILKRLTPRKQNTWKGKISSKRLSEYVDSILALKIFGLKPNCLNRSLILYYFLHKIGVAVKINFGIRKANKDIEGHGWLTLNGKPYLEKSDTLNSFCLIYSYPGFQQTFTPQVPVGSFI